MLLTMKVYGANELNAAIEETDKADPIMHAYLLVNLPSTIGLFCVLAIIESCLTSVTCPKHYVDIATA